jgi:hypothetical protein
MEVLAQGSAPRRDGARLPRWIGRAAVAAALAGTALGALPSLRGDPAAPASQPAGQAGQARQALSREAQAGPQPPRQRPGAPGLDTSATILLRGAGAVLVDVDTGHRVPLPDMVDWSGAGDTVLLGRTVVTVVGRGQLAGRQVVALEPDDRHLTSLGPGSRVLPATPDSVWLVHRGDARRTVARVGLDGGLRLPPRPLPSRLDVSGAATSRQLVVGARWPSAPGPLMVWDVVAGRATRILSRAAVVHSSDRRHVVWSACSTGCPLMATRLGDASTRSLGQLPAGFAIASRLRLSPDGRHYAVLASRGGAAGLDLLVGHLPGSPRAGAVSSPLRGLTTGPNQRPRLSYARSGWLFVSTGDQVYAVGPGPHVAFALDALPRHERMVAS